MMDTSQTPIHF